MNNDDDDDDKDRYTERKREVSLREIFLLITLIVARFLS